MKTACIVHYNTQELTEATILSLAKQEGGGWRVFLFDNSDRRPWDESSPAANVVELHVIDNTRGDIIDFESELERLAPARDRKIGEAADAVRQRAVGDNRKEKVMEQNELFRANFRQSVETCRSCAHRQRWQCGGRIIQYCGIRKSKRTTNGLLKIKVTKEACCYYKEEDE